MTAPEKHNAPLARGEVETKAEDSKGIFFPDEGTVKAAVLADLLEGRRITHLDCWREHSSSRLAHHVYKLKELGWPITTIDLIPRSCGRRHRSPGKTA